MKTQIGVVVVLVSTLTISGCENVSKETVGGLVGAAVGAAAGVAAGGAVGDAVGEGVGMVVGFALGAVIGQSIGAKLDELDKILAEAALQASLDLPAGETVEWKSANNAGVGGKSTVYKVSNTDNGRTNCRTIHTVVVMEGKEANANHRYCRTGQQGNWKIIV